MLPASPSELSNSSSAPISLPYEGMKQDTCLLLNAVAYPTWGTVPLFPTCPRSQLLERNVMPVTSTPNHRSLKSLREHRTPLGKCPPKLGATQTLKGRIVAKGRPPSGQPLSRDRDARAKAASYTKISAPGSPLGPELGEPPDGTTWHPHTVIWWHTWRTNPMATLFNDVDFQFLLDTALAHSAFCHGQLNLAGEIRLRTEKMGATNRDRERMRLQITDLEDDDPTPPPVVE